MKLRAKSVNHEMKFALEVSDRVIFMEGGKVVFDGTPARLREDIASDRRLADFVRI